MNAKTLFPVVLIVILAMFAICVADESDGAICDDVKVYIQDPQDGTYEVTVVDGIQTVRAAVEAAMRDQGHEMTLNLTETNIKSVDGVKNTNELGWRIFQWLPDGNKDWGMQTFQERSDDKLRTGCTLCVTRSSVTMVDNYPVYSVPDFEPKSTGYVFIRFANGFNPDEGSLQDVFTPEIRQEGFWIKGEGSNMGEVLVDAVERNWPGQIEVIDGSVEGAELASWIVSLFGLETIKMGDGAYAYWSQWTWQDHKWGYNDWTLGYYDPAVYRYVECIYLISSVDPYDGSIVADKGGPEPNPETEEIKCLKNRLTVTFNVDGKPWYAVDGIYGESVDMEGVPQPEKEGMGFTGWGDVTQPLKDDTVFEASFTPITDSMVSVTYYLEDGTTLLAKEYLEPGGRATYDGIPKKADTEKHIFEFMGWDRNLESVTRDLVVKPVFKSVIREYNVYFHDYDRSLLYTVPVKYGSIVTLPEDPERSSTVMYQFEFVGWSKSPNSYLPVESLVRPGSGSYPVPVTDTTYAYAYYKPIPAEYTIRFMDGDSEVGQFPASYGSTIGGSYPLSLFEGEYLAKMYHDRELTDECPVNTLVLGDTTVYVRKIPGIYSSEVDDSGRVSGPIFLDFDEVAAGRLTVSDGCATICDVDQFPDGTKVVVMRSGIEEIVSEYGEGLDVSVIVPRGFVTLEAGDMLALMGGEDSLSVCVRNGPSSVKISSSLKKLDYNGFYRVDVRAGNHSIMELADYGFTAVVGLSLGADGLGDCDVWNIRPSGATASIESDVSGAYAVFTTDLLQFFAVGSSDIDDDCEGSVVPYGDMDVGIEGEGMSGIGTIRSISIDGGGKAVFIPSSYGGCTIRHMIAGSLNGVTNSDTVVIPVTVNSFSWDSWTNSSVRNILFLGPCPMFEGTVPYGVTVYADSHEEGWNEGTYEDLDVRIYNGSFKKDVFSFSYYLVDDEVVLHRYIYGRYISIPDEIAVDGVPYPITYVGDGAFMQSDDEEVRDLYRLRCSTYILESIEIGASVKDIMTRAFYGSRVATVITPDNVEHLWDEAFKDAWRLNVVRFSDNLLFIGESAFEGCYDKAFARFDMPDSVREVRDRAFAGCSEMTKIVLGNGLTAIPDGCFEGCVNLTDLDIPDGVLRIGDRAFYDCSGLLYVDLNNVEKVGDRAFMTETTPSAMEFIVMGENLVEFGPKAFFNCDSIMELEAHCPHFESFEGAFDLDPKTITIFADEGVEGSWPGYKVEPLAEKIPEKDNTLLVSVEIGLIVMFAILGILSFRLRQMSRVRSG